MKRAEKMIVSGAWLIALSVLLLLANVVWQEQTPEAQGSETQVKAAANAAPFSLSSSAAGNADLPAFAGVLGLSDLNIMRRTQIHTIIPTRSRETALKYTVASGDSVFGIAKNFNLKPETILWANFDQLQDAPDSLSPGMELNIPPVDGVYYEWAEGDTLEAVAQQFEAEVDAILNWPGNELDLTNPQVETGQSVMIPGGEREYVNFVVPQIARGNAGVSSSLYGAGACTGSYEGAYGSGGFIWPSANHFLSGNDFWSGHLGIDIAGGTGDGVWAADAGVVVFAGWANGGYGYMVMVDHGNGYQTLYAHLNSVSARCGQSVGAGTYVGAIGSTGNSTGSHLHFEIRIYGQFINPWHVLP